MLGSGLWNFKRLITQGNHVIAYSVNFIAEDKSIFFSGSRRKGMNWFTGCSLLNNNDLVSGSFNAFNSFR